MDLARLCREQHLPWLHANVYVFYPTETKIGARPVQHDGAAGIDHMCLEEHFIDPATVGDDLELVGGEV